MKTKALYAGSFDPLTLGHLDIIERAANLFDQVVIGVVVNLEKKTMFTFEERMEMIKEATAHLENVTVDMCDGLLADFVNKNKPSKDFIVIGYGYKINKGLLFSLKRQAHKMGFKKSWCFQIGSAVTSHTGGECIGFAAIK